MILSGSPANQVCLEHLNRRERMVVFFLLPDVRLLDLAGLAYEAALAWFLCSEERQKASRAAHGLGRAHWRQNALQEAREALERSLELGGDQISANIVLILVDLSMLLTIFLDQLAQGGAYAERALDMALRLGDPHLEATTTRMLVAGKIFTCANDISIS